MDGAVISNVILASGNQPDVASVGLVVNDRLVFWGDIPPFASTGVIDRAAAHHVVERASLALRSSPIEGFRALSARAQEGIGNSELAATAPAHGVLLALQSGLLAAVSHSKGRMPAAVLADEYKLMPARGRGAALYIEISDFNATAENIDVMLSFRPAGIGYRLTAGDNVAEAIGEAGQILQRFVRELGQRADALLPESSTAIYLGLNGALGYLVGDPVRHTGRVLGHCVGLQIAAGKHHLILEDPFVLESATDQAAYLHRLKDFLQRTAHTTELRRSSWLVGRVDTAAASELFTDADSVDALLVDLLATGDIESVLSAASISRGAGLELFLAVGETTTPRWIATLADVAAALGPANLLVTFDGRNEALLAHAARCAAESARWSAGEAELPGGDQARPE